jgi:phytoene synthase
VQESSIQLQVKKYDNYRYLCGLFASEEERRWLYSLYAFELEMQKIYKSVSEPIVGFIKYAWWREAIEGIFTGQAPRHEVVQALARTAEQLQLNTEFFEEVISGYEFYLENSPPKDMEQLLYSVNQAATPIFRLATLAVGVKDQSVIYLAEDLAAAWQLINFIYSAAKDLTRGTIMFPENLMQAYNINYKSLLTKDNAHLYVQIVKQIMQYSEELLNKIYLKKKLIPKKALPVFLLAPILLKRIEHIKKHNYNIMLLDEPGSKLLIQLNVFLKAFRGSI